MLSDPASFASEIGAEFEGADRLIFTEGPLMGEKLLDLLKR